MSILSRDTLLMNTSNQRYHDFSLFHTRIMLDLLVIKFHISQNLIFVFLFVTQYTIYLSHRENRA